MSAPRIRGRCPGAHHPMRSQDGLVVRVRPMLARLTRVQVSGLCQAAERFGNGMIELTNRANLQLRGVDEDRHAELLLALEDLGLLDRDPAMEARRNILVTPFYQPGDLTARLGTALAARLRDLPGLPSKFGFALDCGAARVLHGCSADIRFELGVDGGLMLRADGADAGCLVPENAAIDEAIALADWFADNMTGGARRMAPLLRAVSLPRRWRGVAPAAMAPLPAPGPLVAPRGRLYGAPFGQIEAAALAELVESGGAGAMRTCPGRMFLLEGAEEVGDCGFVTAPGDPLLRVHACSGAPYCPQAQGETRNLARLLAPQVSGVLHVSGCAKGCALAQAADVTLIARGDRFDLVKQGCASDEPAIRGLSVATLLSMKF